MSQRGWELASGHGSAHNLVPVKEERVLVFYDQNGEISRNVNKEMGKRENNSGVCTS